MRLLYHSALVEMVSIAVLKCICSLSLLAISCSQQLECRGTNGSPICDNEASVPTWVSFVMMGMPIADHPDGIENYAVTWTPDLNIPMTQQSPYRVAVREVDNSKESTRIFPPTNDFNQFTIMNLTNGIEYEVMVCYDNVTEPDLPAIGEFSSDCGSCRTCFTPQPTFLVGGSRPRINRATSTVEMFPDGSDIRVVYTCRVDGDPTPHVRWTARNGMTNQEDNITRSTLGAIIGTSQGPDSSEVTSTLAILQVANFNMPTCLAENPGNPESFDELRAIDFVSISEPLPKDGGVTVPGYAIAILLIVPGLLIAAIVVGIIVACIYRKRYKKEVASGKLRSVASSQEAPPVSTAATHDIKVLHKHVRLCESVESSLTDKKLAGKTSLMKKLPQSLILEPDALQVSTIIGQGEFGVVYKGYLKSDMMDTVAVKTLKGIFTTANDIRNVSAEILKMKEFDHPNVMPLIGVCVDPADSTASGPCIVMPFMAKGSLLDYLRREADHLFAESEEDKDCCVVRNSLLRICLQIARGMEYLSKLKFIHRDLAARNCLIDAHGGIRVGDFGLAEDIYSQNYFRQVEGGVKLPLKWMALESIKLGVFTEKTDVWSYGVTCWEIFSGGAIPYPGVHPHSVLTFIEDGGRLARPKNAACGERMYKCMLSTWESKHQARPCFSSIVRTLSSCLESTSDYLVLTGHDKEDVLMEKGITFQTVEIEDSPGHSIHHVPSLPNNYYVARSLN